MAFEILAGVRWEARSQKVRLGNRGINGLPGSRDAIHGFQGGGHDTRACVAALCGAGVESIGYGGRP